MKTNNFWVEAFARYELLLSRGFVPTAEGEPGASVYLDRGLPQAAPPLLPPYGDQQHSALLAAADGMPYVAPLDRPQPPVAGRESAGADADATNDWLREIARALVDHGDLLTRDLLRRRGLSRAEIAVWVKAAKQYRLDEYLCTDLEEHRATIAARLEDVYVAARAACDLKAANTALKNLATVTGVTKDDAGAGMGEFAKIVQTMTKAAQETRSKVGLVVDGSPQIGAKP